MTIFFLFLLPLLAMAQHHEQAWFRATALVPVSKKLSIDAEFQHRRQNNVLNENLFEKKLLNSYRLWMHYKPDEKWVLSVSPLGHFTNYRIIQKKGDELAQPVKEIRFSAAMEFKGSLSEKLSLVSRGAAEYRLLQDAQHILRLRNRMGFKYVLNPQIELFAFDELMLNLNDRDAVNFFDQNRSGISVQYKNSSPISIQLGYMHISRLPLHKQNFMQENDLFVNLVYDGRKKLG